MSDTKLAADARRELLEDILPFWRKNTVDEKRGGFVGEISNDLHAREDAPKGLILNTRILWTFSAAHRFTRTEEDARLAHRAFEYLAKYFLDKQHGGYFWEVGADGELRDAGKKIYGQAFCIYSLAEYYLTFHDPRALHAAIDVFGLIEDHAYEPVHGGYLETVTREWRRTDDMRLSSGDMNAAKSMNNHLHVLEAYTNLLRVWKDEKLTRRLGELIDIFSKRIVTSDGRHFNHFFDESWKPQSDSYTFGHDIEGSWLLCEAAEMLHDRKLLEDTQAVAIKLARSSLSEGLDQDGGLLYEGRAGKITNAGKEWWPQGEAVVGFYNAWQITGEQAFLDAAERCWRFIQEHVVDKVHGEWFWRIRPDGTPDPKEPKVSFWKCPYHNGRCCLEIIHRAEGTPASRSTP